MSIKSDSLKNGNKGKQLAEGSEMESNPSLVGTGAFADNIPAESKIYPVVGMDDSKLLIKSLAFKRVTNGF